LPPAAAGFDRGEEVAKCTEAQFRQGWILAHFKNLPDHFLGDRSAMIANAKEEAGVIESWSKGRSRRRPEKTGPCGVVTPIFSRSEFAIRRRSPTRRVAEGSSHVPGAA
jgi:hypothetical protein